jgi:phosphate acetyltransferase
MATTPWVNFRQKAAQTPQRILLAEGEDPRVIQAAALLQSQKTVHPWLVGSRPVIEKLWKKETGKSLDIPCIDPASLNPEDKKTWAEEWLSIPKNKKKTPEEALSKILDPLVLGCLALRKNQVDGFVGGATRTTADTLRAVFHVIGLGADATTLFGFFLMENKATGTLVILADCAVVPDPSPKQLCNIALGAADAFHFFMGQTPRLAFLSFSTLDSAANVMVDKVKQAVQMARGKAPHLAMEGEWQADTALDAFTASIKGVGASPMAGKANVLIVPDLNCGNIAYKLVQRLGQVRAVGPVLWGTALPANDLSRGCSAEDIVDMAALTAIQAQSLKRQPVLAHKEGSV